MKKAVDPVMADYAKEIGAEAIYAKINGDVGRQPLPAGARSLRRNFFAGPRPCDSDGCEGGFMRKLIDGYYRVLNMLLVVTVAVLVIPVTIQILSRHTALIPTWIWTEEMARFFFIWMIMIGSMVGIRDGAHFDVDLWPELEPRANALLRVVADMFVLVMALVFIWYGIRFVQFGWDQTSELAELPMALDLHRAGRWPASPGCVFLGERFLANLRYPRGSSKSGAMSGGGALVAVAWRRWSCSASSSA